VPLSNLYYLDVYGWNVVAINGGKICYPIFLVIAENVFVSMEQSILDTNAGKQLF
jgi:hypothetical protein